VIGSVSIILSGNYPINLPDLHSFWSAALFVAFGTSFAFSAAALRYHQESPRWLLTMAVLIALADMAFSVFFNGVHILEWVMTLLLVGYILALGGVTRLISTAAKSRTK
jgi:hypothetical protein